MHNWQYFDISEREQKGIIFDILIIEAKTANFYPAPLMIMGPFLDFQFPTVKSAFFEYTGCPVNWYSLSISIPDFSDCPIKKNLICNFNPNGLTYILTSWSLQNS